MIAVLASVFAALASVPGDVCVTLQEAGRARTFVVRANDPGGERVGDGRRLWVEWDGYRVVGGEAVTLRVRLGRGRKAEVVAQPTFILVAGMSPWFSMDGEALGVVVGPASSCGPEGM